MDNESWLVDVHMRGCIGIRSLLFTVLLDVLLVHAWRLNYTIAHLAWGTILNQPASFFVSIGFAWTFGQQHLLWNILGQRLGSNRSNPLSCIPWWLLKPITLLLGQFLILVQKSFLQFIVRLWISAYTLCLWYVMKLLRSSLNLGGCRCWVVDHCLHAWLCLLLWRNRNWIKLVYKWDVVKGIVVVQLLHVLHRLQWVEVWVVRNFANLILEVHGAGRLQVILAKLFIHTLVLNRISSPRSISLVSSFNHFWYTTGKWSDILLGFPTFAHFYGSLAFIN